MNYLIWNGKDSREIKGLVICELPPIIKPQMRVEETAVNGVDGSIIEELGYSSYDKALTIGLTQNADIDEISQYFTGSGEIVFSNEPNKYYKATIINQIDYTRLVRFKVATVVFKVQPFKYEYMEKEKKVSSAIISGVTIKHENNNAKLVQFSIAGKSVQETTPTPDAPVEIKSVGTYNNETGKYEITVENGTNSITIQLDEPLRSLPNGLKDTAYIKGNKLYVDRKLGRVLLNGSEIWHKSSNFFYITRTTIEKPQHSNGTGISSHFKFVSENTSVGSFKLGGNYAFMFYTEFDDLSEWREWLSQNNVEVIYDLLDDYIEDLGEVPQIELAYGENNISNSEKANMVVRYIDDDVSIINKGNYIAKPVIEIAGSGTINVALNGNNLFRYTFPENEDTVIIDSQKQDAYLGTYLKNRNMVGDFPIFEIGENTLTWEGVITSIKISSKSRWL